MDREVACSPYGAAETLVSGLMSVTSNPNRALVTVAVKEGRSSTDGTQTHPFLSRTEIVHHCYSLASMALASGTATL